MPDKHLPKFDHNPESSSRNRPSHGGTTRFVARRGARFAFLVASTIAYCNWISPGEVDMGSIVQMAHMLTGKITLALI
jgi:hypothetical protein